MGKPVGNKMSLQEAYRHINDVLGESVLDYLTDDHPQDVELNYDKQLIIEIARACLKWKQRQFEKIL